MFDDILVFASVGFKVLTSSRMFINHTVWDLNAVYMYVEDITSTSSMSREMHVLFLLFPFSAMEVISSWSSLVFFSNIRFEIASKIWTSFLSMQWGQSISQAQYETFLWQNPTSIESLVNLLLKVTIPSCRPVTVWHERSTTPLVHLSLSRWVCTLLSK